MGYLSRVKSLSALLGLSLVLTFPAEAQPNSEFPNKIIIMIGDGMGPAYTSAYRYYKDNPKTPEVEKTIFDRLLVGMASTYPARESGYITDSAASATALATGHKSYNGAISVDTQKRPIKTIMEIAKERGMAIGVAVTSQINHATPAAFLAHNESRRNYEAIANSYLKSNADVMLGGGQRYFSDVLISQFESKGYQHITQIEQLKDIKHPPVIGLFADVQLAWEKDTSEAHQLSTLTHKALELLNQNEKGFVLLVEGSLIDWAGHSNDITTAMAEVNEFANSIAVVEQFVQQHNDALMVVTADHNTGGLSVAANGKYVWQPDVLDRVKSTPNKLSTVILDNDDWKNKLENSLGFTLSEEESLNLETIKLKSQNDTKTALTDTIKNLIDDRSNTGWTSSGHTGVDVQIFAAGKNAGYFSGHKDNTDIARILISLLPK